MANVSWLSLANDRQFNQTQTGAALANSTVLTDISAGAANAAQALALPANYLQAGQLFRVRANGVASTTGTPNLTLGLYWGGVAGVALATTGAVATASGLANNIWRLDADLRVDATGASGSIRTFGQAVGVTAAPLLLPPTSGAGSAVTVDTSVTKLLTVGALWGTASVSNSIQCLTFSVEQLN